MFKRVLSFLAVLTLLVGCAAAETAVQTNTHQIETRVYPFYLNRVIPSNLLFDFPLFFVDGVKDLPFVDLVDWVNILNKIYGDNQVNYSIDKENSQFVLNRINGSKMICDFLEGTLSWDDFNAFFQTTTNQYINIVTIPITDAYGQPYLLQRVTSSDRHGQITTVNLSNYGIQMITQNGHYLIPLQTLSAFSTSDLVSKIYFNGECLILAQVTEMKYPLDTLLAKLQASNIQISEIQEKARLNNSAISNYEDAIEYIISEISKTEIGQTIMAPIQEQFKQTPYYIFLSGQSEERSQELVQYGYNELCLELDSFYGLKEAHSIKNSDSYLSQILLKDDLLSTNPQIADKALSQLTNMWLDDGHTTMISYSYTTNLEVPKTPYSFGQGSQARLTLKQEINTVRAKHPESQQGYYEIGNTAYITFDQFTIDTTADYYTLFQSGNMPNDTIGQIVYAHQQITRPNSPIENVVLDLSNNSGGSATAATFVLGWFLGSAQVSVADMFSGAQSTATYRADTNLDHRFDEDDTISHLHLYCLISPITFSCGNLLPWAFKENGKVTLLGKPSGGGSCYVQYANTAWGASFQYSGPRRLSFVKNGSFYDIDQGVAPDYFINSYDHFYDREALTEFINSLY